MKRSNRSLLSLPASLVPLVLLVGQSAGATASHGTYTGPNVDFTVINETTNSAFGTADPEPLLGTMTPVGDSLTFAPTAFNATATGGTFDEDHTTLDVTMDALTSGALDLITITESGYVNLTGPGTNATGAFLGLSGTLQVTAGASVETFTFGADSADAAVSFSAGVNPAGDGGGSLFDLVTNPGMTAWTGTVSFDVVALLASRGVYDSATHAVLAYDDILQAFSESGSTADVWKTNAIVAVPEPATGALLAGGLMALCIRARRRRV